MIRVPDDFVALATAYGAPEGSLRSVIGVVVDIMPPTITRTGDHMLTFKLRDPSIRDSYEANDLRVRFFRKDPKMLPQVKQCGDVVLAANIKMSRFSEQPIGISHYNTHTVVFPAASIPDPDHAMALTKPLPCLGHVQDKQAVELAEQAYVIQLKHEMRSDIASLPQHSNAQVGISSRPNEADLPAKPKAPASSSFGRKFRLVKDLRHREFADICGQVVKKFAGGRGCELYITDYTENKDMFFYAPPEMETDEERDGDDYGYTAGSKKAWPGPYGFLVLKVTTVDPHSSYANHNVKEGDFVLLKNVKMKVVPNSAKLEGDMWPDRSNPDKVDILKSKQISDSPEVHAFLERKDRYWAARKSKAPSNEEGENKKPTKSEKRRLKKQQQKANAAAAGEQKSESNGASNSTEQPSNATSISKKDLNPHIRCGHQEIPISPVRTILDPDNKIHTCKMPNGKEQVLPFVNAKYRTCVRVVDFEPKQLEDFALPSDDPALGAPANLDSSQTHEWAFMLLLEDATKPKSTDASPDSMWVTLHHEEVQYLFGNNVGDPTDLRSDAALLAKVKQQLFTLWGNLEEKKDDEEVSNRAFECCLMEYGVEMDDDDREKAKAPFGYQRLYAMFGTTIL